MKLSEAMREGCKKTTPARFCFYRDRQACALGAAYVGRFGLPGVAISNQYMAMEHAFPDLQDKFVPAPPDVPSRLAQSKRGLSAPLEEWIVALNDQAFWSRERIADWLESLGV